MPTTRRTATTAEIVKIASILAKAIKKNKDGTVYYKDGQTDESIAGQIGNGLTYLSVARIRKELHGNLPKGAGQSGSRSAGISTLEARVKRVEEFLAQDGYEI